MDEIKFDTSETKDIKSYAYPVEPDPLEIFAKYGFLGRSNTPSTEFLSLLISKTALETQKVSHEQIQEIGEKVDKQKTDLFQHEKEIAVARAIEETQRMADERLQKELAVAAEKANQEKKEALESLTDYYKELAQTTDDDRTKLEKEREEKLIIRKDEERVKALAEQWERAEILKAEAIERVLIEQRKELRAAAALQREEAIADALRVARESFQGKLNNEVVKTRRFCEKIMQDEKRKIQDIHQVEVIRLRERIAATERQLEVQMDKMRKAQRDYWEMENEYCNFLDYTSSAERCPTGFLVTAKKRMHGKSNVNRDQNVQTRLISLDQESKAVQTEIKFRIH